MPLATCDDAKPQREGKHERQYSLLHKTPALKPHTISPGRVRRHRHPALAKSPCARILLPLRKVLHGGLSSQQREWRAPKWTPSRLMPRSCLLIICNRASDAPRLLDSRDENHDDRLPAHHAEPADVGILHDFRRSVGDDCLRPCGHLRCHRESPAVLRPAIPVAVRTMLHDRNPDHTDTAPQQATRSQRGRCTMSQLQKLQLKGTKAFSSSHSSIGLNHRIGTAIAWVSLVGWRAFVDQLHAKNRAYRIALFKLVGYSGNHLPFCNLPSGVERSPEIAHPWNAVENFFQMASPFRRRRMRPPLPETTSWVAAKPEATWYRPRDAHGDYPLHNQ